MSWPVGTEARGGEGHMDTAQGFLLCSCFSELQKASEQLDPKHLTTLQQNKTNHAGSQPGLPVNHSNCRFIGSDGPGSSARPGKSFAFYLLVFLASGFLPWFLPSLRAGFIPSPADPGTGKQRRQSRKEWSSTSAGGAAASTGGQQHSHTVLELCCTPQAGDTLRSHHSPSLIQLGVPSVMA